MAIPGHGQPNQRLLLLQVLLRPVLEPAMVALAQQLVATATATDLAWLVRTAVAERAATWLLPHVERLALAVADRALLERGASLEVQRTLQAEALRLALLPLLTTKQPLLLLLKGTSIEARAYPPGILRPCTDLDLLVLPQHVAAAKRALMQLGLQAGSVDANGRTQRFGAGTTGCAVDLHFRLGCPRRYPRYGTADVVAGAAERAVRLPDGCWTLGTVDTTVHLLQHLAAGLGGDQRHLADAGQWLKAAVVRPEHDLDVARLVQHHGLSRAVRAALHTLARRPGNAAASTLLATLGTAPLPDRAVLQLQRQLVATHYVNRGPVLPPLLLALTELTTIDGLAGLSGLLALRP